MAKKKKKNNIIGEVGLDGTITSYNSKNQPSRNIVAEVGQDGSISKFDLSPVKTTTTAKKKKENDSWFKAGAFDDGYDIGDLSKTILGTTADAATGAVKGIFNLSEGIVDLGRYGVSAVANKLGAKEYAQDVKETAQENTTEKWFKPIEKVTDKYSVLGNKSDSITQGLGYVGGMMATGGVAGAATKALGAAPGIIAAAPTVATTATTFSSSMGSGMSQAYQGGATDDEAVKYGIIAGTAEAGTELIFGGLGKTINAAGLSTGLSSADDMLAKKVSGVFKSTLAKNIASGTIKASAEGSEEVMSGIIQAIGQKLTYKSEEDIKKLVEDQDLLESFISGAVVSGIAQSPSLVKDTKAGRDLITGYTENEQKVIDKTTETKTTEAKKQKAIENKVNEIIENKGKTFGELTIGEKNHIKNNIRNNLQEKFSTGEFDFSTTELSNKEIQAINKEVKSDLEKGNISIDTIEGTLASQKTEAIKELNKQLETTKDTNQANDIRREIMKLEAAKNSELKDMLQKDNLLQNSYREEVLRKQQFTYETKDTDSDFRKSLAEEFSQKTNNSTKSHETFEMLSKLADDKQTNYGITTNEELTELGHDTTNQDVNGLVRVNKDGTQKVLINIDSPRAINRIVGHETTHLLEGSKVEFDELKQFAKEFSTTKGEYDTRIKNTKELYKGTNANIENEVTADIVGDYLFTDRDFVNQLSVEKPNIFQKVYNEVKHLYKLATAGSQEARQLEKLKKSFEKAYRQNVSNTEQAGDKLSLSDNQELYNKTKEGKQIVHSTNQLTDLLNSDNVDSGKFSIAMQNAGQNVVKYGQQFIKFKPEILDYVNESKMFKGDGATNRDGIVSENANKFNTLEEVINDNPKFYNELLLNGDMTKDDFINTIESVTIPKNSSQELINILKDKGIDINYYNAGQSYNETKEVKYSLSTKDLKTKQNDIIQKSNPVEDDYHTWIRSTDDIKTFEETLNDSDYKEYYEAGEDFDDSYTADMAKEAVDTGKITVYSSYPITDGVFVSPSQMEASQYAGGDTSKLYSKEIDLTDVAWIDPTQGQYAKVENNTSANTKFSLSVKEAKTTTDNKGRKLSKDVIKFNENNKTVDENGNLITVYHTMTNQGEQFNEFNPVGTPNYRFGDQVVNYYTDGQEMSGSYADQNYEMADTKRISNDADLNEYLNNLSTETLVYRVEEKDGKYNFSVGNATEPIVDIKTFDSKSDLYKNIKATEAFYSGHRAKYQYEGYVNITNPYVVDAEGRKWDSVSNELTEDSQSDLDLLNSLTTEQLQKMKDLAKQSEEVAFKRKEEYVKFEKKIFDEIFENDKNLRLAKYFYRNYITGDYTFSSYYDSKLRDIDSNGVREALGIETPEDNNKLLDEFNNNKNYEYNGKEYSLRDILDKFIDKRNEYYTSNDSTYFKQNYKEITDYEFKKIKESDMYELIKDTSLDPESVDNLIEIINNQILEGVSTNEIVKRIIEANKNGANYDGVIIKNVVDYGGYHTSDSPNNLYITFNSNQFKGVDNTSPTSDSDIRYSLSNKGQQIAPSRNDVFGSDIKYQSPVTTESSPVTTGNENIAPVQQTTNEYAPLTSKDVPVVEQEATENLRTITDDLAPVEVDNSPVEENKVTETKDLFETRDYEDVGNQKVKAYQYENPEVRPYFREVAKDMIYDVENSQKGERVVNADVLYDTNGEAGVYGIKRNTTPDIGQLLDGIDGRYKLTYDQIKKGLNDIIEDNGAENNAASKRIEFFLDERLRNGFRTVDGIEIPANEDYIQMLKDKQVTEYNDEAYNNWVKTLKNAEAPVENASNTEVNDNVAPVRNETIFNQPVDNTEYKDPIQQFLEYQADRYNLDEAKNQPKTDKTKKSKLRQMRDTFQGQFINKNVEIDNLAKESGNKNIKFAGDMFNNVAGEVETDINKAQTDIEGREIGKGIKQIFQPAKDAGLYDAFNDYLIQKSNIERHSQGKGSVVPANVSEQLVHDYEVSYPEFKTWSKDVYQYNRNILNNEVAAGLVSPSTAQFLVNDVYPSYVPFYEVMDDTSRYFDDRGNVKAANVLKRAKGGANNISAVEDSMIKQTYAYKKAIRQNELYKEIVGTLDSKISIGADLRSNPTQLDESLYVDEDGNKYLTAYINGEQESVSISDDLYNGLKNDSENRIRDLEERYSLITKPLQKVSEWRRNLLTTWSPSFILTNPMKDIHDAVFNSKYVKDMIKNYPGAFKEIAQGKTAEARQFMALYGSGNTMGEFDIESGKATGKKNIKFLNGVSNLNNIVELAPRFAEFKASLQNGTSVNEAMYNAREITTNFGRGGTITKALNRNGFTFLNASVQGMDKFIRNFSGENGARGIASSLAKAVSFGVLPALANALMFGTGDDEDEDYKVLPDYIKDNYYVIKTGDGEFVRIPKGRMISVFGSAARRTLEAATGTEDAFEGFLKNAYSQTGVSNPLTNNILSPILQAYGSKEGEAWYGGDLVPTRLQNKPTGEQYDESTDEVSKFIGDKLGISPYKLNYVLDQYSGGIGDLVLPTITEKSNSDGSLLAPLKDKFTANSTGSNKNVGDIYTLSEKLTVTANGSKATDEDVLRNKYISSITSDMGKLYAEQREVQNDSSLSKAEKNKKAQAIKKEINLLADEGLSNYKKVSTMSNYATAGDKEYYKNTKDKWVSVNDEELDDLNSMGMTSLEKNSYFQAKNEISNIKNQYKDSSDNIKTQYDDNEARDDLLDSVSAQKKREIVAVIRNSGLSDEEKAYVYGKNYGTETVNVISNAGINIDDFLDYSTQNFEADYNAKGKAITNSRKKKVINYVNQYNLSIAQKAILIKSTNSFKFNNYNRDVLDYVSNLNITYNDKVGILKKIDMNVDSNGKVTWK